MIDIHTHILPGVDDGSDSMEKSLEMAELAVKGGVRVMVVTPHSNITGSYLNYEKSGDCLDLFLALRQRLTEEKIPLKIARGMEIYGVGDIDRLILERQLISLNHSEYYLIEFPFSVEPDDISYALSMIFQVGGTPLLAHPERYYCVQESPNLIFEWMKDGVLTQINKGSFLGEFGRPEEKTATVLMEHGLITCLASDCHSVHWRPPGMLDIRDHLRSVKGDETAQLLLFENPKRILSGNPVIHQAMQPIEERRRFFSRD